MDRSILHIDMNSCFASIECLHHPEIRDFPVAVAGDIEARHGIILAKNEHAKKYGIKTGEVLWHAKQKCPDLIIMPPSYEVYLRFSKLAREIYSDYTDQIESFGIDECWLDVTGSKGISGSCEKIAQEIRKRIKFELGITVSIGVSWNKIFAKLGSDYKKPDAVTVFNKDNYKNIVWPLPAEDLLYVGRATKEKLYERGIKTIGDIAGESPQLLNRWFGKLGYVLYCFANGDDSSPVARTFDEGIIKSIGNSTTAPRDLTNAEDASIIFYMLCESVAERLREHGFLARTVQISLRDNSLFSFERQCALKNSTCISAELHSAAMQLLEKNYFWQKPLRSIGIRATDLTLSSEPLQLSLFEDNKKREKAEKLECTVDDIRRRFGHYSICRAVCTLDNTLTNINPKEDHVIHPIGFFKAV